MSEKVKHRIGFFGTAILVYVAAYIDIAELTLDFAGTAAGGVGVVVGLLVDFAKIIVLPGLLILMKAPFWKGKKAKKKIATMITTFLVGAIPWIGAVLPETLIGTIATIIFTRKEDNEKMGGKGILNDRNITRAKRIREKIRKN